MGKKKAILENVGYDRAGIYLDKLTDPNLKEYFSLFTGGTFRSDIIKQWMKGVVVGGVAKKFSGLMFWYCLDTSNTLFNKLYVAVEPKYDFKYPNLTDTSIYLTWKPNMEELLIPSQFFGETIFDCSLDEKTNFLKDHKKLIFKNDTLKSVDEVIKDIENFKNESLFSNYQKYPFAYFIQEERGINYFNNFFNSGNVEYIRYYFGFDNGDFPNKLRLILVPVGVGGKNIEKRNLSNDYLLQKSWPPPPESF